MLGEDLFEVEGFVLGEGAGLGLPMSGKWYMFRLIAKYFLMFHHQKGAYNRKDGQFTHRKIPNQYFANPLPSPLNDNMMGGQVL